MKKFFLIIIAVVMGCVAIEAAQLTPTQKKAKIEIYNVLKKYGSNISDSGEEAIEFQYNGAKYEVSVHMLNPQTLYLSLSVVFGLPEEYITEVANIAANAAASPKPVCAFAGRGILAFSCEMYAKEVKPFLAVFPEMLQALNSSVESFQDEYDKAIKDYVPFSVSSVTSMGTDENTFIYPKVMSSGDSKLHIEKVTLDPNYTVLDMVSYNGRQYQWCSISKNSYLSVNGKRYNMTRAEGIACSPQHTDFPGWDSGREVSLHFKLFFPALPKGTTSFDFSEGSVDGWNLKGVELKHGNAYAINGEKIETTYHRWDCTAIEVQDGQTIVTKTVQPKSEGTFMYSSQDEYIEDAETGRKYYLLNSSIGFEGSPEISHDTKTITFYEVYPALPSSVKKINISSGSQYYVKDLKIR
ncbi:MAG: hypothetical protein HDS32_00520 [Bacteroides sp.]|nr:hypothetical protein [Bacteroides sp.]